MFEFLAAAFAVVTTVLEITVNLAVFATIVMKVLQSLGIIGPEEEKPEDLGDKALQAEEAGIVPENYDSYEAYLKDVESFETDPEKSSQIDDEAKLKKGAELVTTAMIEKFGNIAEDLCMIIARNPEYFEKRMPLIMSELKDTPDKLGDVTEYLQGRRSDVDKDNESLSLLYDVEKKINPDATMDELENNLKEIEARGAK